MAASIPPAASSSPASVPPATPLRRSARLVPQPSPPSPIPTPRSNPRKRPRPSSPHSRKSLAQALLSPDRSPRSLRAEKRQKLSPASPSPRKRKSSAAHPADDADDADPRLSPAHRRGSTGKRRRKENALGVYDTPTKNTRSRLPPPTPPPTIVTRRSQRRVSAVSPSETVGRRKDHEILTHDLSIPNHAPQSSLPSKTQRHPSSTVSTVAADSDVKPSIEQPLPLPPSLADKLDETSKPSTAAGIPSPTAVQTASPPPAARRSQRISTSATVLVLEDAAKSIGPDELVPASALSENIVATPAPDPSHQPTASLPRVASPPIPSSSTLVLPPSLPLSDITLTPPKKQIQPSPPPMPPVQVLQPQQVQPSLQQHLERMRMKESAEASGSGMQPALHIDTQMHDHQHQHQQIQLHERAESQTPVAAMMDHSGGMMGGGGWWEEQPKIEKEWGVWKIACKMRVWEIRRRYTPATIRSVVAQEADDYFASAGLGFGLGRGGQHKRHPWDMHHDVDSFGRERRRKFADAGFMDEEYYDWEIWSGDSDESDDESDEEDFEAEWKQKQASESETGCEDDVDAEGEMEADIEAFEDPSFNAELSSPPVSPLSPFASTSTSVSAPLQQQGDSTLLAAFYVPPTSPEAAERQRQAYVPIVQSPILPLPPPRLGSFRVHALREGLGGLVGRGTPVDKSRAAEWGRGVCREVKPQLRVSTGSVEAVASTATAAFEPDQADWEAFLASLERNGGGVEADVVPSPTLATPIDVVSPISECVSPAVVGNPLSPEEMGMFGMGFGVGMGIGMAMGAMGVAGVSAGGWFGGAAEVASGVGQHQQLPQQHQQHQQEVQQQHQQQQQLISSIPVPTPTPMPMVDVVPGTTASGVSENIESSPSPSTLSFALG